MNETSRNIGPFSNSLDEIKFPDNSQNKKIQMIQSPNHNSQDARIP